MRSVNVMFKGSSDGSSIVHEDPEGLWVISLESENGLIYRPTKTTIFKKGDRVHVIKEEDNEGKARVIYGHIEEIWKEPDVLTSDIILSLKLQTD